MQRRSAVLLFLLACGLAGCGGSTSLATAPAGDTTVVEARATPTTTAEVTATPPSTAVTTPPVATTAAPPATRAPATTEPRPVVIPTTPAAVPLLDEPVDVPDQVGAGCDPSYPGVCIPPAPPDLDCADISYRRFAVVGADPHRFDADNDGIGCESG